MQIYLNTSTNGYTLNVYQCVGLQVSIHVCPLGCQLREQGVSLNNHHTQWAELSV